MMDNNIKQRLDKELEDIYVTKELKRKTLEKCKSCENRYNKNWLFNKYTKGIALACSLILVFSCSYFLADMNMNEQNKNYSINDKSKGEAIQKKTEESLEKPVIMNNHSTSKENIQVSKAEKPEAEVKKNNPKPIEEKTTSYEKNNEVKNGEIKKDQVNIAKEKTEQNNNNNLDNKSEKERVIAARSLEKDNIESKLKEAEKFWNGKILLPSYIPEEFKLYNIDTYEKDNKKFLSIIYRNKENYFQIEQVKGEDIDIALEVSKNVSELGEGLQEVTLNEDGVLYRVNGNIPKDILQKVIESIK